MSFQGIIYRILLFCGAGAAVFAQPSIDAGRVLNTSGDQVKLAPGAIWVIYGKNLGPGALATATGPDYPTNVSGTSVTFTPAAGGSVINAKVWYALSTQAGGFLPSSAAPGTYNVAVTYNNQTSAPQSVVVAARSMGVGTSNGLGTGPAQATIANVNGGLSLVRYTTGAADFEGYHWTLTPSHPGDEIVLWGTGGGADVANDPGASPGSSGDQTAGGNFIVTVGTRQIVPDYAGTVAGYPGLWQINVHLPSDIALDCFAPVQVSAGGEVGNLTSIAIAAPGATACSDSQFPLSLLTTLDTGRDIIDGVFAIAKIGAAPNAATSESASGFFGHYTATSFVLPRIGPKFNGCEIFDRTYPLNGADPASPMAYLDAGSRLPISGMNFAAGSGLTANSTATGPVYSLSATGGTLTGATYTLAGSGGAAVGPFTAMAPFPASFTGTNWNAINLVDRTSPLTFTWTGSGFDQVYILVGANTTSGSNRRTISMNCVVPAAPGTFTIPAAALAYMPAVPASGTSFGSIAMEAHSQSGIFTAPLVAGGQIDLGVFASDFGYAKNVAIQ